MMDVERGMVRDMLGWVWWDRRRPSSVGQKTREVGRRRGIGGGKWGLRRRDGL